MAFSEPSGPADATPTITGDVVVEEVTLNRKGGSLTATLKRGIRAGLNADPGLFYGARLDFAAGGACVLMAPAAKSAGAASEADTPRFHVTRVSPHRFVVDLVDDGAPVVDPMTEALLIILREQVKAGQRKIVPADDSAGMFASIREKLAEQDIRLRAMSDK